MPALFDHEKLQCYQQSISFIAWVGELLEQTAAKAAVKDQLDRASTSIALNIAEGNGKVSIKDRARYFESARGSALECAACLEVMVARRLLEQQTVFEQKHHLVGIVRMITGLLNRMQGDSVREDEAQYFTGESDAAGEGTPQQGLD